MLQKILRITQEHLKKYYNKYLINKKQMMMEPKNPALSNIQPPVPQRKNTVTGMLNKSALANEEIESVKEPPMSAAKGQLKPLRKILLIIFLEISPNLKEAATMLFVPMRSRKEKKVITMAVWALYSCWNHRLCS